MFEKQQRGKEELMQEDALHTLMCDKSKINYKFL